MLQTIETVFFIVILYAWLCVVGVMILGAIAPKTAPEPKAQTQLVQQTETWEADVIFAEIMEYRKEQQLRSGNTAEFQAKIQLLK